MAWVVDTCLIIDVLDDDPEFGVASARLIDAKAEDGLQVSPITYVELAPAFLGDRHRQDEFLELIGIDVSTEWLRRDTWAAHRVWNQYVSNKRGGRVAKRPIADILIGSFACGQGGPLTRNSADFTAVFPKLQVVTP
jgi:predicted nucleic acid-binding protein